MAETPALPGTPPAAPRNHWIAVACAEHVALGRSLGVLQVGHGKGAPLRRVRAGDRVAYYSSLQRMGGPEPCQAFTAIGVVRDDRIYQADMGGGFMPYRKDVAYDTGACLAPIRPLLDRLSFTRERGRHWGGAFRYGLLKVSEEDMDLIAQAMHAHAA